MNELFYKILIKIKRLNRVNILLVKRTHIRRIKGKQDGHGEKGNMKI